MDILDFVLLARTYGDLGPGVFAPLEAALAGCALPAQDRRQAERLADWLRVAEGLGVLGVARLRRQLADRT